MQHHRQTSRLSPRHRTQGFSLIEMLVVIAVIGVIAAIGTSSISNVNESAKMARDQRNAQNIASMFNSANVAGVAFASNTKEGILDELIAGKSSPTNGIDFKFTPLTDEQKTATLAYCEYDATADVMKYANQPIAPEAAAAVPEWGPWIEVGVFVNNQVASFISSSEAAYPNREYMHYYAYDGHSLISYRELQ